MVFGCCAGCRQSSPTPNLANPLVNSKLFRGGFGQSGATILGRGWHRNGVGLDGQAFDARDQVWGGEIKIRKREWKKVGNWVGSLFLVRKRSASSNPCRQM